MLNIGTHAAGPSATGGMELNTIWEVNSGPGYNNRKNWTSPGNLIAVMTLRGKGVLILSEKGKIELTPDTLIIVEQHKLKQYYCSGESWKFWWFEFSMQGALPFPLHRLIKAFAQDDDRSDLEKCQIYLLRTHFAQRALASSIFCTMLYRWLAVWDGEFRKNPHQVEIENVISEMHKRMNGFSLREMAKLCFLSERRFRQVFLELTGKSPKTYYDQIRLQMGEALLRQGICNISEAAEQLGFSSPFHFSRSFSRHFGYPPSKVG